MRRSGTLLIEMAILKMIGAQYTLLSYLREAMFLTTKTLGKLVVGL